MELIEQKLEKAVIDKFIEVLPTGSGVSVIGIWQPAGDNQVKGEEGKPNALLAVKAYPRTYETPTIPDAEFQIDVSLAVRSDEDYNGMNYLEITSLISDALQDWQNDFGKLTTFNLDGLFRVTGFNLTGGDCGLDIENCVWQYSQSFTIYGIVEKKN